MKININHWVLYVMYEEDNNEYSQTLRFYFTDENIAKQFRHTIGLPHSELHYVPCEK